MNSVQPSLSTTIGGVAGRLPYNHLVFKGEDPRAILVGHCFQVLCALLDFQSGSARDVTGSGDNLACAPTPRTNAFRYFLAKLVSVLSFCVRLMLNTRLRQHRTQDFQFIIDGILGILEQHIASHNNLLPGSKRSVPYVVEASKKSPSH